MARLAALEQKYEVLMLMVNGKAEYSTVKTLEESYMRINEIVESMIDSFANKNENEESHHLLSMNLRNLYELFINHNHDEPKKRDAGAAFTT